MSQPQEELAPSGDRPIVIGGGPQMITVQLPGTAADKSIRTFTLAPKDPTDPFKQIVITAGASEVIRFPLTEEWKITIA
jgi:hypothetical protein